MLPNLVISAGGLPKAGKNHFAYTAPDPIKVYCFNGGASFVASKFKDKKIEIHNFTLPIIEDTEQQWALPVWNEFYAEFNTDVASKKFATLVLDTGSEVENFCRQATLEEMQDEKPNKKKLATNEYLARNLRMNAIFARTRNAGINLISLQYMRDEWIKIPGSERAEPTGKLVLDGWNQTEAQADVNLLIESKLRGNKTSSIMTIKSNRFDRDMNGQTLTDGTFNDLTALLFGE